MISQNMVSSHYFPVVRMLIYLMYIRQTKVKMLLFYPTKMIQRVDLNDGELLTKALQLMG